MEPIDALNALPAEEFGEALRPLFEVAQPLADALYAARPFTSYPTLIDTAEAVAMSLPDADQVRVLSAHPRIGADPDTLSAASLREQGKIEPAYVYTELAHLNAAYEQRFGFRFVVFVNGRSKAHILAVLRERIQNSRQEEQQTGLREMFLIARDRYASA